MLKGSVTKVESDYYSADIRLSMSAEREWSGGSQMLFGEVADDTALRTPQTTQVSTAMGSCSEIALTVETC